MLWGVRHRVHGPSSLSKSNLKIRFFLEHDEGFRDSKTSGRMCVVLGSHGSGSFSTVQSRSVMPSVMKPAKAKIEESEAIVSEEQKEKKDSKKPEGAEEPKNEAESKDDQKDEKPEDGKGKEEANKTEEAPKKIEDSRKQGKLSGTEDAG